MLGSKGVAIVWLNILFGIVIIGALYLIGTQILFVHIEPMIKPEIESLPDNSTGINKTEALETWETIYFVWRYFPLILLFGLILWGIVSSQKKEPDTYYAGY